LAVDGEPLITIQLVRPEPHKPARYGIRFSENVPVTCGNGLVTDEVWIKHFDSGRSLAKTLSSEAYTTLLSLAVDMTEERKVSVSFRTLARRRGRATSTTQLAVQELVSKRLLEKIPSFDGNQYRVPEDLPLRFGGVQDPRTCGLQLKEIFSERAGVIACTDLDPNILNDLKEEKEVKEKTTQFEEGFSFLSRPSDRTVVVMEAVKEKQPQSASDPISLGTPDCLPREKPHMEEGDGKDCAELKLLEGQGRGDYAGALLSPHADPVLIALAADPVPFVAAIGAEAAKRWISQYGLERCMEVWGKAQTAHNPGGYMRKALEEGWRWVEAAKPTEPVRPYLMDHAASRARAAELAGIQLDSRSDDAGVIDPDWVSSLRQIVRAR
jgi:hypothetical protein